MDRRPAMTDRNLTPAQLLAFGFPAMTHALIASPVYSILPTFYAANTAVTLAQIGTIAAFSRIIDALNDPVMGWLSDRTRTRFGSRKPWLIGAILFCAAAVFQLFSPPATATAMYFLLWSQVLYTGFTMFEVPRSAWSAEISREYNERARIGLFVGGFNIAGSLSFYLLPILVGFFTGSSEINAGILRMIAWIYVIVMPAGILLSLWLVPQGVKVEKTEARFRDVLATIAQSRPAQLFFGASFIWGLGQGVIVGCSFIFYTDYMGLKAYFAIIMGLLFLTEISSLPAWAKVLPRFDRHRVWAVCVGGAALLAPLVLLLPRGPAALPFVLCLVIVRGILTAPTNFLPGAVLGDVIDYDTLKTGANKAGNLFAVQMVLIKIAMAVGGALAFNLLDVMGYRVGKPNTDQANLGLLVCFLGLPAVIHLTMAAIAWNFPITRRRQGIIQKRLLRRAAAVQQGPAGDLMPG